MIEFPCSKCLFSIINFVNLFYYSAYFYYYLWVLLHFLILFMDPTILFQVTFTFIYSIFSKKNFNFSKINGSKQTLTMLIILLII